MFGNNQENQSWGMDYIMIKGHKNDSNQCLTAQLTQESYKIKHNINID